MVSEPVMTALIAATVTVGLGVLVSAWRYVFGVSLATTDEVAEQIQAAHAVNGDNEILKTLNEHTAKLNEIEDLILGGEYQVDDGMLEVVRKNVDELDEQGDRIDSIERIQLKIRRRQGDEPEGGGENGD